MVVVHVRDGDRVQTAQRLPVDRRRPAQVDDPRPEHRVGQQPNAVELDEDRAVPDPGDPHGG